MKEFSYYRIFEEAFFVSWKNKFLWFFGFFIFLGCVISNINYSEENSPIGGFEKVAIISDYFSSHRGIAGAAILFGIIFLVAVFLLSYLSRIAIIKALNNVALYGQLSFRNIFIEARGYFWKILLLEIVIGLGVLLIALVVFIPIAQLFELGANLLAGLMMFFGFLIVVPVAITGYYLYRYATYLILLANLKTYSAIEFAFAIFRGNLKKSLMMGVFSVLTISILLPLTIFAALGLAILFLPIGLVLYFLFIENGLLVSISALVILELVFTFVLFSWYTVFIQGAWLIFFQEIAAKKHAEKKAQEKEDIKGEIPAPEAV